MICVMIVDDHKLVVEGLRILIDESGLATVSAVAYDIYKCRNLLASDVPDVLILTLICRMATALISAKNLNHFIPN